MATTTVILKDKEAKAVVGNEPTCYYCGTTHSVGHNWHTTFIVGTPNWWLNCCEECLTLFYNTMVELRTQNGKQGN